jgi:hypothetical protein
MKASHFPNASVISGTGGGNIGRLRENAAGRTDPVPRAAEFAGSAVQSANSRKKTFVNLSIKAQGHRELVEALQSVVHRRDVIGDFFHIDGSVGFGCLCFEFEEVDQRCLVPSIWLDRAASRRTHMKTNRSGFGRASVAPSRRPRGRSVSDSSVNSSSS